MKHLACFITTNWLTKFSFGKGERGRVAWAVTNFQWWQSVIGHSPLKLFKLQSSKFKGLRNKCGSQGHPKHPAFDGHAIMYDEMVCLISIITKYQTFSILLSMWWDGTHCTYHCVFIPLLHTKYIMLKFACSQLELHHPQIIISDMCKVAISAT